MTAQELIDLRKAFGLTQAQMYERIGLKKAAYQNLEAGKVPIRPIHVKAVERAALHLAVEHGDPMKAPAAIRKDALDFARMIEGKPATPPTSKAQKRAYGRMLEFIEDAMAEANRKEGGR